MVHTYVTRLLRDAHRAVRRAHRRHVVVSIVAIAVVALTASPAMAANQQVTVNDDVFIAPAVAVIAGESVTWSYTGSTHHTVTFEDGLFDFEPIGTTWATTRTFSTEGVRPYFCNEHGGPGGQGMSGRVYVNATGTVPGAAPSASFTVPPGVAVVGQNVVFDASGTTDADDALVRFQWDLDGNGSFEVDRGAQPSVSQAYQTPGTRTVGLRVFDATGHVATTTRNVTVTNAPNASFTVAPGSVLTGQSVGFDASASADPDGTVAGYEWDLDGDGSFETSTSSTPTTSRSYASPATLTIALRVTDDLGAQTVTTRTLQVSSPPPPESPPAATAPPPPPPPPPIPTTANPLPTGSAPAPCSTLKGAQRTACLQKRCRTLKGPKRASCISSSCRYVTGAKRASCMQSSCRYLAASKRASCGRASCRYLTGAKRTACTRKYARKPSAS
jgi:plastocyanin